MVDKNKVMSQLAERFESQSAVALTDKQKLSIYKKSQKSGYPVDILEEVYRRGIIIWGPEMSEGTREQFAFDRVNSFISGGIAADLDSDLIDEGNGLWANIHAKRKRGEPMRKPGEKGAPTKEAFKAAQNEEIEHDVELEESAALAKKSKASGVPLSILRKVYNRGVAAWRTGHRPGTTPQQWGMARVNSYITKGKGTYHGADKDLREGNLPEVPKDKETGLPKKYTTGNAGTDRGRAAHFAKGREKHWDDPSAYGKAPGDATAKTRESKHTKKYREMYGEQTAPRMSASSIEADISSNAGKPLPAEAQKVADENKKKATVGKFAIEKGFSLAGQSAGGLAGSIVAGEIGSIAAKKLYGEETECDCEYCTAERAEKQSTNPNDPSSRFIGTDSLVNVYKLMTPGQNGSKTLRAIKDVVRDVRESEDLTEKASSIAQQRLMALALQFKRGELENASPEVKKLASSMTEKQLRDFAKTKHKGLPEKVDENLEEAGAFSYGKKPRKGTVAYNAMMMRKQQEKNQKPIEPKDQKVGIAKVTKNLEEATFKGKKVTLNKPFRTPGGPKKSAVYVDPDGDGKAKIVRFGDPNLSIKKHRPARKRSYCARSSGQGNLTNKASANYWSRRAWDC